jgi:hypothetical protein
VKPRLDIVRPDLQLGPERVGRLRQLSLAKINHAQRSVRFRYVRLDLERALKRRDRSIKVSLLRVRLAEEDVDLGVIGVRGEELVEDDLGVRAAAAANERQAERLLQSRIGIALRVVP